MPEEGQWRPSFLKPLERVNVNSKSISLLPHLGSTELKRKVQGERSVFPLEKGACRETLFPHWDLERCRLNCGRETLLFRISSS